MDLIIALTAAVRLRAGYVKNFTTRLRNLDAEKKALEGRRESVEKACRSLSDREETVKGYLKTLRKDSPAWHESRAALKELLDRWPALDMELKKVGEELALHGTLTAHAEKALATSKRKLEETREELEEAKRARKKAERHARNREYHRRKKAERRARRDAERAARAAHGDTASPKGPDLEEMMRKVAKELDVDLTSDPVTYRTVRELVEERLSRSVSASEDRAAP